MLGAGTVINPIIKIVTTVAILAAVYFFIIKPVLNTTEDTINRSFDTFDNSFKGFDNLPTDIQSQIDDALGQTNTSGRFQDCIQKAIKETPPDQQRIDRCVERFTP
jgi:hypothetical protein